VYFALIPTIEGEDQRRRTKEVKETTDATKETHKRNTRTVHFGGIIVWERDL